MVEVYDLQYASPATISRCGMVYVDPKNLGYNPYWKKWVNTRPTKQEQDWMHQLYDKYVPFCIDMIVEGIVDGKQGERMKTIVPLTNLNMVTQLSMLLDSLLENEQTDFDILEAIFLQALYWSLGAGLLEDGRTRFDNYVKNMASMPTKDEDYAMAGRDQTYFVFLQLVYN